MATEAQRRASARYNRLNMKAKAVNFSPRERDLLEHVEAQGNVSGYLKKLIREDMERNKK